MLNQFGALADIFILSFFFSIDCMTIVIILKDGRIMFEISDFSQGDVSGHLPMIVSQ
jgi:hypothetical protein